MRNKFEIRVGLVLVLLMGVVAAPLRASEQVCGAEHRAGDYAQCPFGMEYVHEDGADFCRRSGSIVKERPLCRFGAEPKAAAGHDRCPERMPASATR